MTLGEGGNSRLKIFGQEKFFSLYLKYWKICKKYSYAKICI